MINDALKMTGHLAISINNEVVCEVPNLVVLDGKEFVASRMKDTTKAAIWPLVRLLLQPRLRTLRSVRRLIARL